MEGDGDGDGPGAGCLVQGGGGDLGVVDPEARHVVPELDRGGGGIIIIYYY